ncbi:zinc knuckle CX2CX4HX4C containing protein [Tanacetum coccineum]
MEDPSKVTQSLDADFNKFIDNLNPAQAKVAQAKVAQAAPSSSFASVLNNTQTKKSVTIKELRNSEVVAGARVLIPLAAVEEVSSRFVNTLYGYFIGKRLAFPLVENYVKNSWAKFGLKRIMLDRDFFLFQFENKEGMDKVIESGPWLIRLVPLILNVWTPNAILKKDEIRSAPVWVKLYHVPVVAYSEIGLSLITTQIGRPIMLDTYTSSMCLSSWGRKEYARALIEVSAEEELLDSMVIAIPLGDGMGHSFATIDIEYEWKPPRCSTYKIFDHTNDGCPKNPKVIEVSSGTSDGFTEVKKKKNKSKQPQQIEGIKFTKPKLNLQYRKVDKGESSKTNANPITKPLVAPVQPKVNKAPDHIPTVSLSNSFNTLETNDNDKDDTFWGPKDQWVNSLVINESDSEGEEMVLDDKNGKRRAESSMEGASTPVVNVPHD